MADTLLPANIFFVVATAAILFLTAIAIILSVYIIRIVRDISRVVQIIREESEQIVNDVKTVRENIKSRGQQAYSIFNSIMALVPQKKKRSGKNRKTR